jgi:hypothetical protein
MPEETRHPAFPQPKDANAAIWRYLDFQKFHWLVENQRLFMPRAADLGDPLEGTQPQGDRHWWQSLVANAISAEERATIEHNRDLVSRFVAAFRTRFYVSCWHMNECENLSMWSEYTTHADSVAIHTTFSQLRTALPAYVEVGMVRYINYAKDRLPSPNMFEFITHKNECFGLERELRAVAMHSVMESQEQKHFREHHFQSEGASGQLVYAPHLNVRALVKSIVLHPNASNKFTEKVLSICQQHGLPNVRRSSVNLPKNFV